MMKVMDVQRGQVWKDEHGTIKVMAVVDNYVVARRPRYTPFVVYLKDFLKLYTFDPRLSGGGK